MTFVRLGQQALSVGEVGCIRVPADPDELASEFTTRGVTFGQPHTHTHDELRGFEVTDPDGYVLFFGRPRQL